MGLEINGTEWGDKMPKYHVAYMVVYSDVVEAENAREAADIVARECPYDVDGYAHVVRIDTDEEWDYLEDGEEE